MIYDYSRLIMIHQEHRQKSDRSKFESKKRRVKNFPVNKIQIIELNPRGELIP